MASGAGWVGRQDTQRMLPEEMTLELGLQKERTHLAEGSRQARREPPVQCPVPSGWPGGDS